MHVFKRLLLFRQENNKLNTHYFVICLWYLALNSFKFSKFRKKSKSRDDNIVNWPCTWRQKWLFWQKTCPLFLMVKPWKINKSFHGYRKHSKNTHSFVSYWCKMLKNNIKTVKLRDFVKVEMSLVTDKMDGFKKNI